MSSNGSRGIAFAHNPDTHIHSMAGNQAARQAESRNPSRVDVGLLTVLCEETYAVVEMLQEQKNYRRVTVDGGQVLHEAVFAVGEREMRVVAMQSTDRGQPSGALTFSRLYAHSRPRYIALIGVAGGVHPSMEIGDVLIADSVVFYDPGREAKDGLWHTGPTRPVPVPVSLAVQGFLGSRREPTLPAVSRTYRGDRFKVHFGPIGSSEAAITDSDSHIRRFRFFFNGRVLAVDTEAAGLAQGVHETVPRHPELGWLVIRGISDKADQHKGYTAHSLASAHAAHTLKALLPHL